ncbi:putative gustatory receptor 28b [Leptopilina heterotoma]|uniref:putative gustatory receptor 28b n=1 Tax=Leptopilina heterotoma TaxID=63436 RepID=UPI001CA8F7A8|nr:putative gustatory receptor 28b [Leptopilina heterotoma]
MVGISTKKKNFSLLVKLVFCYEKLIGLCPVVLGKNGYLIISNTGAIYSLILCIVYSIFYARALINRSETVFPMETFIAATVATYVDGMQFIIVIIAWLIFAFRQRRIIFIFENFEKADRIARKLGIKDENQSNIKMLCTRIICVNIIFGGLFFSKIAFSSISPIFKWIIWVPFEFPHIVIHNLFTLFITALDILERQFHKLNSNLTKLTVIFLRKHLCERSLSRDGEFPHFLNSLPLILNYFGKLHDELMDLSEMITDFFAPVTLMALLISFLQVVKNSYFFCLFITDFKVHERSDLLATMYGSLWISVLVLEFIFLSFASGTICYEANNTGNALLKLWVYYRPANCQKSIIKFSHQLIQRKLKISLYGFIDLNYHFIYKIFGALTTYLIIMLQMDDD